MCVLYVVCSLAFYIVACDEMFLLVLLLLLRRWFAYTVFLNICNITRYNICFMTVLPKMQEEGGQTIFIQMMSGTAGGKSLSCKKKLKKLIFVGITAM